MFIFQVAILLFLIILKSHTQAAEIAREVEGGVELLSTGEIELILPDDLSFTVKSTGSFVGKAEFCYAAQTTINHNKAQVYN
uniref:OstA-like_N domain-containing protein n=1 Tax=Panagrellus redivivus TaxID=6233 RepID=A0A7E4ULJ8_PANRE